MTRTPRILTVAGAAVLIVASLGCGLVSQARNVVDTAVVLGEFADRLGRSSELTFTAEYEVSGGERVTLVQQPPNSAFVSPTGRFIFTPSNMIICDQAQGRPVCQRAPNQDTEVDAASAGLVGAVAGPSFVTAELALGLVAAAALVPGAKVDSSDRRIAGQQSKCADVTNLDAAAQADGGESLRDFSVCVTETGILASFTGTGTSGEKLDVRLTGYRDDADPAAFRPPAGATVTDVSTLNP